MTFPKENKITKGQWFCKEGENQDVILSTRARIVRNLADFSFPNFLTKSETERVEIIILDALKDDSACEYYAVKKEEMSEKSLKLLNECGILKESLKEYSSVVLSNDGLSSLIINSTDHVKISSIVAGLNVEEAMKNVYRIDEVLQKKLQFAASYDFGYLSSRIKDSGTGLKFSVYCHIPGIVLSGEFETLKKEINKKGYCIKKVFDSTTDYEKENYIFELSTDLNLCQTEIDQSIDLKSICQLIIKKERKIKAFFADNKSVYAQNFVQKSWGKVLFSLFFDFNEAMSVIMAIKFGVELKIISLTQDINFVSLIYQIKDHHIDYLLDNYDFSFEEEIADNHKMKIQRLRAVILQQSFEKIELKG